MDHFVRTSQLAWAIQKESPFREAFYYNINKLKEIGVIKKYFRTHSQIKQRCDLHGGGPIEMKQCVSAFFLLIGGVCTGLVLFGIELCIPYKFVNWIYDVKSTSYKIPIARKSKAQKRPTKMSLFSLKDRKKIHRYNYNKRKQYFRIRFVSESVINSQGQILPSLIDPPFPLIHKRRFAFDQSSVEFRTL